jgi:hypothetical protein
VTEAARWIAHSPMSDPGEYAALFVRLSGSVGVMNDVIQGVLVHSDWLSSYGLDESWKAGSRETLGVAERLKLIFSVDPRSLDVRRPPAKRSPATCRDFALMLVSALRTNNIPARLRCGFAAYLGGAWEDHWVCEYWDMRVGCWRLADPQIDNVLRTELKIDFDPSNLPREFFLTAGEAWRSCRAGRADAGSFGHGRATGLWFMRVNVVRDHFSINNRETSPWDGWRAATEPQRARRDFDNLPLDALAASPEQPIVEWVPDWLT